MSLTQLLRHSSVRSYFNEAMPAPSFVRERMLVQPGSGDPRLVGAALDIAITSRAQRAWGAVGRPGSWRAALRELELVPRDWVRGLHDRARAAEADGAEVLARWNGQRLDSPTADACLRLARLGAFAKSVEWHLTDPRGRLPLLLAAPSAGEVEELQQLFALVPDSLAPQTDAPVVIHPSFREGSAQIGGAEGDLLVDDTLVEMKVIRAGQSPIDAIRQVVLCALLANAYGVDPGVATRRVNRVAIYLARSGQLLIWPLDEVLPAARQAEALDVLLGAAAEQVRNLPGGGLSPLPPVEGPGPYEPKPREMALRIERWPEKPPIRLATLMAETTEAPVSAWIDVPTKLHALVAPHVASVCRVSLHKAPVEGRSGEHPYIHGSAPAVSLFHEAWTGQRYVLDRLNEIVAHAWVRACYPFLAPVLDAENEARWRQRDDAAFPRSGNGVAIRRHLTRINFLRSLAEWVEARMTEALVPYAMRRGLGTPPELPQGPS